MLSGSQSSSAQCSRGIDRGRFEQVAQLPPALKKTVAFNHGVSAIFVDSLSFVRPTPIGKRFEFLA